MFWVIVASNSGAVIYRAENRAAPLEELETLDNSEYRMKDQDIDADRPGRSFDRLGEHRHAMAPDVDPREQIAIRFAKRVADRVEAGRLGGEFEALVLVAAPKFLGRLRAELSEATMPLVNHEIAQNLLSKTPAEIREHLPDYL